MRIMIALVLAWMAGFVLELGHDRDLPAVAVGVLFLAAWWALGSMPALRRRTG